VCYRVGDPQLGWSEEFNFTMPREAHQVRIRIYTECRHWALNAATGPIFACAM